MEKATAKAQYGTCKGVEDAYARSFAHAVAQELGKQCRALALIVPEEVEARVAKDFPHLRTKRLRPIEYYVGTKEGIDAAGQRGTNDGRETAMRRAIE